MYQKKQFLISLAIVLLNFYHKNILAILQDSPEINHSEINYIEINHLETNQLNTQSESKAPQCANKQQDVQIKLLKKIAKTERTNKKRDKAQKERDEQMIKLLHILALSEQAKLEIKKEEEKVRLRTLKRQQAQEESKQALIKAFLEKQKSIKEYFLRVDERIEKGFLTTPENTALFKFEESLLPANSFKSDPVSRMTAYMLLKMRFSIDLMVTTKKEEIVGDKICEMLADLEEHEQVKLVMPLIKLLIAATEAKISYGLLSTANQMFYILSGVDLDKYLETKSFADYSDAMKAKPINDEADKLLEKHGINDNVRNAKKRLETILSIIEEQDPRVQEQRQQTKDRLAAAGTTATLLDAQAHDEKVASRLEEQDPRVLAIKKETNDALAAAEITISLLDAQARAEKVNSRIEEQDPKVQNLKALNKQILNLHNRSTAELDAFRDIAKINELFKIANNLEDELTKAAQAHQRETSQRNTEERVEVVNDDETAKSSNQGQKTTFASTKS